jgi:hypothetical protein
VGSDQNVDSWNASLRFNYLSSFGDNPSRHRNQVADDYRRTRLAVIENGGFGKNIIEDTFVAALVVVTGQGNAKRRIDRNGGGAQTKFGA